MSRACIAMVAVTSSKKATIAHEIFRDLEREGKVQNTRATTVVHCHTDVGDYIYEEETEALEDIERRIGRNVVLKLEPEVPPRAIRYFYDMIFEVWVALWDEGDDGRQILLRTNIHLHPTWCGFVVTKAKRCDQRVRQSNVDESLANARDFFRTADVESRFTQRGRREVGDFEKARG